MARLSEREQEMLKRLQAKQEAPDSPSIAKSISVTIDLGNKEQVALAKRHGFLEDDDFEDESGDGGNGDSENEDDEKPKRRGFFEEK